MPLELTLYMILSPAVSAAWYALAGIGGRNGQPQPHALALTAFLAGIVFTMPAIAAEYALQRLTEPHDHQGYMSGIIAGPIEEACKFGAAWFILSRTPAEHRLPGAATAAAVAAAMGFVAVENVAYLAELGMRAAPARFLVTPLLHLSWALVWGRAMDRPRPGAKHFAAALFIAAGGHALYNAAVTRSPLLAIPALLIATWYVWREDPAELRECRLCRGRPAGIAGICPGCGAAADRPDCPK